MNTVPITPAKLKAIHTLLSKYKIDKEAKAAMVYGFSGGRCTSTKDLTDAEAVLLLRHLQAHDPNRAAVEKMKGKIFYYCHEMGWTAPSQPPPEGGGGAPTRMVVDMKRLDAWCLKYSYLHKKLDYYRYNELPKLVSQFEALYKHFLLSIQKK